MFRKLLWLVTVIHCNVLALQINQSRWPVVQVEKFAYRFHLAKDLWLQLVEETELPKRRNERQKESRHRSEVWMILHCADVYLHKTLMWKTHDMLGLRSIWQKKDWKDPLAYAKLNTLKCYIRFRVLYKSVCFTFCNLQVFLKWQF